MSCKVAKSDCKRYDCGSTNAPNSTPPVRRVDKCPQLQPHPHPQLRQVERGQKQRGEVKEGSRQDSGQASKVVSNAYCQGQGFPSLFQDHTERKQVAMEPEQEDSVPSFPMDSFYRGHMLKEISPRRLFYRFPILKRKGREKIRHQLERLGGGSQVLGTLLFQRPTGDFACWKGSWNFFTTVSRELQQANKYYLQIGRGGQGDRVTVQWGCRLCV